MLIKLFLLLASERSLLEGLFEVLEKNMLTLFVPLGLVEDSMHLCVHLFLDGGGDLSLDMHGSVLSGEVVLGTSVDILLGGDTGHSEFCVINGSVISTLIRYANGKEKVKVQKSSCRLPVYVCCSSNLDVCGVESLIMPYLSVHDGGWSG